VGDRLPAPLRRSIGRAGLRIIAAGERSVMPQENSGNWPLFVPGAHRAPTLGVVRGVVELLADVGAKTDRRRSAKRPEVSRDTLVKRHWHTEEMIRKRRLSLNTLWGGTPTAPGGKGRRP
jgi:hypothetical protein